MSKLIGRYLDTAYGRHRKYWKSAVFAEKLHFRAITAECHIENRAMQDDLEFTARMKVQEQKFISVFHA